VSWHATNDLQHAAASLAFVAASLVVTDPDERLTVEAERRLRGLYVVEGLAATNDWTDMFEPVRRRWLWSRRWHHLQSVDEAAACVEWFLKRRPDLDSAAPRG
jgi:hypothetical protein